MSCHGIIIAACATDNCGKTMALRSIWFYLKKNNAKVISEQEFNNQGGDKPGDVIAVLEYQGIRIGISSMGDPGIDQEKILDTFIKDHCRIILCACRTKGFTKKAINLLRGTWDVRFFYPAAYRFISIDTLWNELMLAIRMIKFADANHHEG